MPDRVEDAKLDELLKLERGVGPSVYFGVEYQRRHELRQELAGALAAEVFALRAEVAKMRCLRTPEEIESDEEPALWYELPVREAPTLCTLAELREDHGIENGFAWFQSVFAWLPIPNPTTDVLIQGENDND